MSGDLSRGRISSPSRASRKQRSSALYYTKAGEELSLLVGIGVAGIGEPSIYLGGLLIRERSVREVGEPAGKFVDKHLLGVIRQLAHGLHQVRELSATVFVISIS